MPICYTVQNIVPQLPASLRDDKEIALLIVKVFPMLLYYFSEEQRNDPGIVMAVFSVNPSSFKFASKALRKSKSVALEVFEAQTATKYKESVVPAVYEALCKSLKQDKDIVDRVCAGVNEPQCRKTCFSIV